jgi:hypothetical protein
VKIRYFSYTRPLAVIWDKPIYCTASNLLANK